MEVEGRRKKISRIICVLLWVVAVITFFFFSYKVSPIRGRFVVELGEKVSRNPADYVKGTDWAVNLCELDLSHVKEDIPGTYTATIKHGLQEFQYEIIIQDTKGPKISYEKTYFYVEPQKEYGPEYFVEAVWDESNPVTVTMARDAYSEAKETISFEETGEETIFLTATDPYGNKTSLTIWIVVDEPPVFDAVKECYVAVGSEPNLYNELYVNDTASGDLTGDVVIDEKDLNCHKVGDYEISYYVEDAGGLSAEATGMVHVMEEEKIREGIASGEINPEEVYIAGVAGFDAGIEGAGAMSRLAERLLPSLVHLRIFSEEKGTLGAGFIMGITEEYVYIGTSGHVLENEGERTLCFFDGEEEPFEDVAMRDPSDTAIVKVNVRDIPAKTLSQLKIVNTKEAAWKRIGKEKVPLFFCLIKEEGLEYFRTGYDCGYDSRYKKIDYAAIKVSMRLEPGNSGSAIFDLEGNLVALAAGQSRSKDGAVRYYAVSAEHIVKLYEETVENPSH